jgi:hypothetical protein
LEMGKVNTARELELRRAIERTADIRKDFMM